MAKIKAILTGEKVFSNTKPAMDLFSSQRFGEQTGEKIQYSLTEALFLVESKRMDLYVENKKLSSKQVLSKFEEQVLKEGGDISSQRFDILLQKVKDKFLKERKLSSEEYDKLEEEFKILQRK